MVRRTEGLGPVLLAAGKVEVLGILGRLQLGFFCLGGICRPTSLWVQMSWSGLATRWFRRSGTGGNWRVEASGHVDFRLAVGHGEGAVRVVQEVQSGILGGARWVGRGYRFMMEVQGKLYNAPAGTRAPQLAPEQERHHWPLRGDGIWEVVAGTKCVGDARMRSLCFGEAKQYK